MKCPLTGQECNNPKNAHFSQVSSKGKVELDLCETCAMKQFGLGSILQLLGMKSPGIDVCSQCKSSLFDIKKEGRLGCSDCWEHYYNYLIPILQKNHQGADNHVGKVPKHHMLDNMLAEAIKEERYEDAAKIISIKNEYQQNQIPKTPDP
jgi:protein arginine kinase activator